MAEEKKEREKEEKEKVERIYPGRGIVKVDQKFFDGLKRIKNNSREDFFSWSNFAKSTGISVSTLKKLADEYETNRDIFMKKRVKENEKIEN